MTRATDNPLGPQCLTCKKRRVKCDSTKPTCKKCLRDGRQCPGYSKPLVWKSTCFNNSLAQNPVISPQLINLTPRSSGEESDDERKTFDPRSVLHICQSLVSSSDKRYSRLADSCIYFDRVIIPNLAPLPKLFQNSTKMWIETWIQAPLLHQNALLIIAINHRLITNNALAVSSPELLEYRGEILTELRLQLENPAGLSDDLIFSALLMVLHVEMQVTHAKQWQVHMDAAHAILRQHGGIKGTWQRFPQLRQLQALLIQIDILALTTSPTITLSKRTEETLHVDLESLDKIGLNILTTCDPFPLRTLSLLAKTNHIRQQLALSIKSNAQALQDALDICNQLCSFDLQAWADDIVKTHLPFIGAWDDSKSIPAAVTEWTCFAQCYQSATIVYAVRSITSLINRHSMTPDGAFSLRKKLEDFATQHTNPLRNSLTTLSKITNSTNSAPKAMYKFVLWPLFINHYTCIAYSLHIDAPKMSASLSHLRNLGTHLGSRGYADAADLLEQVWNRRMAYEQKGKRWRWKWDDGFDVRYAFIV